MATQRTAQQKGRRSGQPADGAQPQRKLPDKKTALELLDKMLLIRHFEERAQEMYMKAKIGGFLHLAIGEEATIVGTRRRHARRGLPDLDLPRARSGARARDRSEGRDGRAVRARGRHLARARRLDAPVRPRAPLHGRLRDRRRQPAAGGRRRAGLRLQGRGLRDASACSATAPRTRARSARR